LEINVLPSQQKGSCVTMTGVKFRNIMISRQLLTV
jgi:hypothetical protein